MWHATAWMLAEPGGRWEVATPLPAPLGYGVSATFGGRMWCVGGCDGTRHVATTVALGWDAAARRITVKADALPPLPKPVAYAAGVVVGSRLYVAGGQETPAATVALGTLWSIDLALAVAQRGDRATAQPQWQEHPPCPGPPRILPALGTHAGRVILVSGAELVPTAAGAGPAIPVGGGRLAFLPGDDGALFERGTELADRHPGFPRAVHLYDTSADTWAAIGEIPAAVAGMPVTTPAVAWRGRTVIPSGETKPGVRTPAVLTATVSH